MITILADIQHQIWAHWMRYLFSVSVHNGDGSVTIQAPEADRWKRQTRTMYKDLSTKEQASDIDQAIKVINALGLPISMLAAMQKVAGERQKQDEKWGEQNHQDQWWLAILTEEVGEVSQAILHDQFGGHAAGHVEEELIQVAAVAISWLQAIARRVETAAKAA